MTAPAEPFIGQMLARGEAGGFSFGHWLSGRSEHVEPHGHDEAHFILITAGDFVSAAEGRAQGPMLIFNPPGTYHDDHFEAGGAFFSLKTPVCAGDGAFDLPATPTFVTAPEAFAAVWRLMRAGDALDTEALCLEALGAVARHAPVERAAPRWLARAADLLRDGDVASVAEAAALVGVHPIHLARAFRSCLGCSPGEFLRTHRLRRAAKLLLQSRRALAEIADACGFADQSHLTRSFTRAYRVPPEKFRRMAQ